MQTWSTASTDINNFKLPAQLITADELAELLRCSRSHVFEMAAAGVIPCYRIGRLVRFCLEEVFTASRVALSSELAP
jgi:excisionase family DNA binding protein